MKNKKKPFLGQRPEKIFKFHVWDVIMSDSFFLQNRNPLRTYGQGNRNFAPCLRNPK